MNADERSYAHLLSEIKEVRAVFAEFRNRFDRHEVCEEAHQTRMSEVLTNITDALIEQRKDFTTAMDQQRKDFWGALEKQSDKLSDAINQMNQKWWRATMSVLTLVGGTAVWLALNYLLPALQNA